MTDAEILDRLRALATGGPGGRPAPEILYRRRKMTDWLNRGLAADGAAPVSKHTVDRLMRQLGMRGLVRGRGVRTTVPAGDGGRRAADLLQRRFGTSAPNLAWVTDFTYVATWAGFVYVAFAVDLYSRAIVGWSAATVKDVAFVEACLRMALWRRDHTGRPVPPGMIHHSDAGSQYTSIRFTETPTLQGLSASIGSVGDAYDNAVAESVIGLYKNEAMNSCSQAVAQGQAAGRCSARRRSWRPPTSGFGRLNGSAPRSRHGDEIYSDIPRFSRTQPTRGWAEVYGGQ